MVVFSYCVAKSDSTRSQRADIIKWVYEVAASLKSNVLVSSVNSLIRMHSMNTMVSICTELYCYKLAFVLDRRLLS